MAGNLGGARPGAGRPKLEASKLREEFVRVATEHAEEIVGALLDQARKGNVQAIKEIADRAIGKVTDNIFFNGDIKIILDL